MGVGPRQGLLVPLSVCGLMIWVGRGGGVGELRPATLWETREAASVIVQNCSAPGPLDSN